MNLTFRDILMLGVMVIQVVQFTSLLFINASLRDLSSEVNHLYDHVSSG